jgi:cell division protein FtsI/penicillin-binding protein 2
MAQLKKSSVLDFRILFLAAFMLAALCGIGLRLWFVQVKCSETYRGRIQGSSEVTVRIPAVRGDILDRNGIVLVTNRPSYEVEFYLPDLISGYKKQFAFAPGSTYKIPVALAGLTKGLAKTQFTCTGGVAYGNTYMKCWIAEKGGSTERKL